MDKAEKKNAQKLAQTAWENILKSYDVYTVTAQKLNELLHAGADVNTQEFNGKTMLMTSVVYRHPNTAVIVRTLLAAGADVNKKNFAGATAIHYLLKHHNMPSILAILLQKGADLNAQNDLGNTALHLATTSSTAKIMQMLIREGGGDPTIRNKYGQTAQDFARRDCDCGYSNKPADRARMVAMFTKIKLA